MPAYPDVPEALAALRDGGFQLAVLTQSAVEAAEAVLAERRHPRHVRARPLRPGLGRLQARGPRLQAAALERAGATEAWFVAGHWWDVAGRRLRGPAHRLDQPHRPRLPDRDARPGRHAAPTWPRSPRDSKDT